MVNKLKQDFNLGKLDIAVLVLSILGILYLSQLLYDDSWMSSYVIKNSAEDGEKLGFIDKPRNEVRRRLQKSLLWFDVSKKSEIFYGDSIYTGDSAGAVVELEDGVTLELQPNSLVVLSRKDNEIVLNLQVGQVLAKAKKTTTKKIQVVQRGKRAKLNIAKGQVEIAKSKKGTLSLAPIVGQVKIEIDNKENIVNENESLQIQKDLKVEKKSIDVSLLTPRRGDRIIHSEGERVRFQWAADLEKADYKLEVAADRDFDIIVAQAKSTDVKAATLDLIDGERYYWRVKASGQEILPSESLVHSFDLVANRAPELLFPSNNFLESIKTGDAKLEFFWTELEFVTTYAIEVDDSEDFSEPLVAYSVPRTRISNINLPPGEYYWRVRGYAGKTALQWSDTFKFKVERESTIPKPALAGPPTPPTPAVETPSLPEVPDLPVAEKAVPEEPEVKEPVKKLDFSKAPDDLDAEEKVRLEYDENSRNPSSLGKITNPPSFKWDREKDYPLYKVEISDRTSFKKKVFSKITKNPAIKWDKAQPGTFYWRVTALKGKDIPEGEQVRWAKGKKFKVDVNSPKLAKEQKESAEFKSYKAYSQPKFKAKVKMPPNPYGNSYFVKINNGKAIAVKGKRMTASVSSEKENKIQVALANKKGERVSPYSDPMALKVSKKLLLKSPKLSFPETNTEIIAFGNQSDDPVIFQWDKVADAKEYIIQISTSASFKKVEVEAETKENNYVLDKALPKGKVYWRVRAARSKFKSPWSYIWNFSL